LTSPLLGATFAAMPTRPRFGLLIIGLWALPSFSFSSTIKSSDDRLQLSIPGIWSTPGEAADAGTILFSRKKGSELRILALPEVLSIEALESRLADDWKTVKKQGTLGNGAIHKTKLHDGSPLLYLQFVLNGKGFRLGYFNLGNRTLQLLSINLSGSDFESARQTLALTGKESQSIQESKEDSTSRPGTGGQSEQRGRRGRTKAFQRISAGGASLRSLRGASRKSASAQFRERWNLQGNSSHAAQASSAPSSLSSQSSIGGAQSPSRGSGASGLTEASRDRVNLVQVQDAIKAAGANWTAGETSVSRLSPEERKRRSGVLLPQAGTLRTPRTPRTPGGPDTPGGPGAPGELGSPSTPSGAAGTVDWTNIDSKNFVTSVKDQGNCGSCWAFAAAASLESASEIAQDRPGDFDLSEQVLLSCSGAGTCAGGYVDKVADFLNSTGAPPESAYPYTATSGNCTEAASDWRNLAARYKLTSWSWVTEETPTVDAIKGALANGPVPTVMAVYLDFFFYRSGVYSCVLCNPPPPLPRDFFLMGYHAIEIIGYDDDSRAFLAKNSWSQNWGIGGFFLISYDEVTAPNSYAAGRFGLYTQAYKACHPGRCVAASTVTCGQAYLDECGSFSCGTGSLCESGKVCTNGACLAPPAAVAATPPPPSAVNDNGNMTSRPPQKPPPLVTGVSMTDGSSSMDCSASCSGGTGVCVTSSNYATLCNGSKPNDEDKCSAGYSCCCQ